MELVIRLGGIALWVGVGALIGWKSGRRGTGMLWALVFGPLGALLFAYGEARRSRIPTPIAQSEHSENLDLPVQVNIEGRWIDGRLQTWDQVGTEWFGWVRYLADEEHKADWFNAEQVRRPEPAN